MAVGLCLIVGMGCRSGFVLDFGYGLPVVLWVCGGWNFCLMMVAPWVSDLLLAWGAGRRHGVWVAGMGCGVWVWPCFRVGCRHVWLGKCGEKKMGVAVWVAGISGWESVGKKNNILIEK
jgi:hypothetical protein